MLKLTGQYLHVGEFVKSHKLHNLVLMDQLTEESSQGRQLKGKKSTIHLKRPSGFNFSIPYSLVKKSGKRCFLKDRAGDSVIQQQKSKNGVFCQVKFKAALFIWKQTNTCSWCDKAENSILRNKRQNHCFLQNKTHNIPLQCRKIDNMF